MTDPLDQLLRESGASFRESHQRSAPLQRRRRRPLLLPVAAGLVTAGVVAAVVVLVPGPSSEPARVVASGAFPLDLGVPRDLDLGERYVAVSDQEGRLEVRELAAPGRVAFSASSQYASGEITCLHVAGSALLWTDHEVDRRPHNIDGPSQAPAGPAVGTGFTLRQTDLTTGRTRDVTSGSGELPCTVGSGPTVAWQSGAGHVTVLDLATGRTEDVEAPGQLLTAGPDGSVVVGRIRVGRQEIVRQQTSDGTERVLVSGDVIAGLPDDGHLAWSALSGGSSPAVLVCDLPDCASPVELGSAASVEQVVAGGTFAAWSLGDGHGPVAVRYDGTPVAGLPQEAIEFDTLDGQGDAMAWVSVSPSGARTLHVQQVQAS